MLSGGIKVATSARKLNRTALTPEGFLYHPLFLSHQEEDELLDIVRALDYGEFVYQGYTAKRKVKHFGYTYEFYTASVRVSEDFPDWLVSLRNKAACTALLEPDSFDQALVAHYPVGAAIGWHRDAPAFGATVVGISLGTCEVMRLRKETESGFELFKQPLERGSLYVLNGPARSVWQHSLPAARQERFSITFRQVRQKYLPSR